MLRTSVLAIAALVIAGAIVVAIAMPIAWPASAEFGVFGALILVGTLFEGRYRARKAGADWKATGERFVDPTSGKLVEVRADPTTGARAYVEIDAS